MQSIGDQILADKIRAAGARQAELAACAPEMYPGEREIGAMRLADYVAAARRGC